MDVIKNKLHTQEYVWDFAVDSGATGVYTLSAKKNYKLLPLGSFVTSVFARCVTAITSAGSCAISWGNTTAANGYSGSAFDAPSLFAKDAVRNGYENSASLLLGSHPKCFPVDAANDADFLFTVATSNATAGKLVFVVEYYAPTV